MIELMLYISNKWMEYKLAEQFFLSGKVSA